VGLLGRIRTAVRPLAPVVFRSITAAPVAASLVRDTGGVSVDGVITIDPSMSIPKESKAI
jgi:hypothetical protein